MASGPQNADTLLHAVLTDVAGIGDMVYTKLFGQDNIVVNSEKIARALLENRSQNYSDRPEIATNELYDLLKDGVFLSLSPELDLALTTLLRSCDTIADGVFIARFFTSHSGKMLYPIFGSCKWPKLTNFY